MTDGQRWAIGAEAGVHSSLLIGHSSFRAKRGDGIDAGGAASGDPAGEESDGGHAGGDQGGSDS